MNKVANDSNSQTPNTNTPSSPPSPSSPNGTKTKSTQTPRVINVREIEEAQPSVSVTEENQEDEPATSIQEYSSEVVSIMKPVSLTMIIVILVVRHIQIQASSSPSQVFSETPNESTSKKLEGSILNALIVLGVIVFATLVVVFFYKMRWMKLLYGWLMLSALGSLSYFGGYITYLILQATNKPLDWITFAIIMWNFSVVGMLSIFWVSPAKLNQFYLISISCFMAIMLTRLPQWTTFALLAIIAIYDLFAVLCPVGPLIWLVETSRKRNEPLPALIYTTSAFILMAMDEPLQKVVVIQNTENKENSIESMNQNEREASNKSIQNTEESHQLDLLIKRTQERKRIDKTAVETGEKLENSMGSNENQITEENPSNPTKSTENTPQNVDQATPQTTEDQEDSGVKLGLGDFVFYSVLIGQAALQSDITIVFTTFIAIITGLFLTLLLLAIFKRALPALPISISFLRRRGVVQLSFLSIFCFGRKAK